MVHVFKIIKPAHIAQRERFAKKLKETKKKKNEPTKKTR